MFFQTPFFRSAPQLPPAALSTPLQPPSNLAMKGDWHFSLRTIYTEMHSAIKLYSSQSTVKSVMKRAWRSADTTSHQNEKTNRFIG